MALTTPITAKANTGAGTETLAGVATASGFAGAVALVDDVGGLINAANPLEVGVIGTVPVTLTSTTVTGSVAVTGPVTDAQLRASAVPVSLASTTVTGSVAVTGPLTDTQLRASAVPVSLTSTTVTGSVAVTGPLTDAQLRASVVPVSLASTTVTGSVAVTGPLTDAQLRASVVPVSSTDTTASGTITAISQSVALALNGKSGAAIQITGTWVGTLQFEGTVDGTNWTAVNGVYAGTSTPATTITANGVVRLTPSGLAQLRITSTAWTSGTATITIRASDATGGTFLNQSLTAGTNLIGKVGIDQTTPGTTNRVDVGTINSVAPAFGSGVRGATVQRVTVATDDVVPVTGTFFQATQPVSAVSLPLPALAATSTKQSDGTQKTQIVDGGGAVVGTTTTGSTIAANTQLSGITFTLSTVNSSTAQLAAAATFTGTIEAAFNQPSAQIMVVCDQAYTVNFDQFDGANNLISTDTFTRLASVALNENIQVNGDACRIRVTNNGGSTTTTLRIETTYGPLHPLPRANTNLGNLKTALNELNGTAISVNSGTTDAGTQRVIIASNQSAIPVTLTSTTITGTVAATQSGTWTVQPGNTANTTAWLVGGATLTKGTQQATGFTTQDLKDAGRSSRTITLDGFAVAATTETLNTMSYSTDNGTLTTGTSYTVTTGKRFRLQHVSISCYTITGNTTVVNTIIRLRINNAGAATVTSPVQLIMQIASSAIANGGSITAEAAIPDGYEIVAGAGIGVTTTCAGFVATTAAPKINISLIGYEY